ncbi:MAG: ABC transporter permease [Bacillota bacterium]|nr:ABC transporter permease [Bacillota bacterium]
MQIRPKGKSTADGENEAVGLQYKKIGSLLMEHNALVILVILCIVSTIISPLFLTSGNIFNLLRQQSTYMVIAIGLLAVMLTGGIDLSVSSIAAVGGIMAVIPITQWGYETGLGLFWAIVIGLGCSVAIGAFNGVLVSYLNMPAFIVTLATWFSIQGVAFILTNGAPILMDFSVPSSSMLIYFGEKSDPVFGIPYPVILAAAVVILFYFIMHHTSFGRIVTAIGSNETAAYLAGINVKRYKFLVYVICGLLSGVAGVIILARSGSATPLTAAADYNLSAIAGVVIGGCSLTGGEGTVLYTVVGVFVIAVIGNIMNLMSLAAYPQMIVKGLIIILAVLLRSATSKSMAS